MGGRELSVVIVVAGASLLAVWLYVRLGDRRPHSLKHVVLHALVALFCLSAAPGVMTLLFGDDFSHRQSVAALIVVFLPAMTYMFLATLYVFEHLQRRLYAR